jgi:hypothetical protein
MKKRKGLSKIIVVGSLALKGLLFSTEASCPDRINYTNERQQNLNKTECMEKYGEKGGFPNSSNVYYSKSFQY